MASTSCTIDTLGDVVLDTIEKYTDNVVDAIYDEITSTAEDGKDLLRKCLQPDATTSGTAKPMTRRQWKNYAKSWDIKQKGGKNTTFINCKIYNKKHYRLTHLLEDGHMTRNGLKTRAFKHIEPVDKYCVEKIEKNIPKIIERGGKL